MVAGKGVGGGKKLGTRREGSERPGPARVGAPQDAGCSRPDGCCSDRGLEEGGTGKREDSAAGPGTRQRDPREPPLCPSLATPDSTARGTQRGWRARGAGGRGARRGARSKGALWRTPPRSPAPGTAPAPPRSHRPSTAFHFLLLVPHLPLGGGPCAPIPTPSPWEGSTQRRSWGPGNPQRTRTLGAL